jgi:CAAX protease family protein
MRNIFVGPKGLRSGWRAVTFVALVAVMVVLVHWLLGPYMQRQAAASAGELPGPRRAIFGELVSFCLPVFIATWIMGRIEGKSVLAYGLTDTNGVNRFLGGAFWGFASLSAVIGLLVLTGHLAFDSLALSGMTAVRFGIEWIVGFLLVGIAEEMALRGYLQVVFSRGIGFWPAAVLLSIGFGSLHISNSGEGVIGIITAGMAGLVFCYSLWRSGSLWWAIGAHTSWDWAQSYFYGVPDSGAMFSRHLLNAHPVGTTWLSGGTVGPEGSIFALLALAADVAVIRLTLRPSPDRDASGLSGNGEGGDQRAGSQVDRIDGARVGAD